MATTYIDTDQCARAKLPGRQGTVAEIVNGALCGAENLVAMLRWLNAGERLDAESRQDKHQLIYLMEGDGVINLDSKNHSVAKGAGIYLGPGETASISPAGAGPLKLLHLVVKKS